MQHTKKNFCEQEPMTSISYSKPWSEPFPEKDLFFEEVLGDLWNPRSSNTQSKKVQ